MDPYLPMSGKTIKPVFEQERGRADMMPVYAHDLLALTAGMKFKTMPDFSKDGFKTTGEAISRATRGISFANRYWISNESSLAVVNAISELGEIVAARVRKIKDPDLGPGVEIPRSVMTEIADNRVAVSRAVDTLVSHYKSGEAPDDHLAPLLYLDKGLRQIMRRLDIPSPASEQERSGMRHLQRYIPSLVAPIADAQTYQTMCRQVGEAITRYRKETSNVIELGARR